MKYFKIFKNCTKLGLLKNSLLTVIIIIENKIIKD